MRTAFLCIALSLFTFCRATLGYGDGIQTLLSVEDALRELVVRAECRDEIEVDPDQFDALKALFSDRSRIEHSLRTKAESYMTGSLMNAATERKAQKGVDDWVAKKLSAILSPKQFDQWRICCLRREVYAKEIAKLVATFSPVSRSRFVSAFGDEFLSGTNAFPVITVRQIELVGGSRSIAQLYRFPLVQLPESLKLTGEQYLAIINLQHKNDIRRVRDQENWINDVVSKELDDVLNTEQRIAVIRFIHCDMLKRDMTFLLVPQIANYLELTTETKEQVEQLARKSNELIKFVKNQNDNEIYSLGMTKLPKPERAKFEKLFEGVWAN